MTSSALRLGMSKYVLNIGHPSTISNLTSQAIGRILSLIPAASTKFAYVPQNLITSLITKK
ncbi:hypothetical protein HKD37_09G024123 [Glycine soja]